MAKRIAESKKQPSNMLHLENMDLSLSVSPPLEDAPDVGSLATATPQPQDVGSSARSPSQDVATATTPSQTKFDLSEQAAEQEEQPATTPPSESLLWRSASAVRFSNETKEHEIPVDIVEIVAQRVAREQSRAFGRQRRPSFSSPSPSGLPLRRVPARSLQRNLQRVAKRRRRERTRDDDAERERRPPDAEEKDDSSLRGLREMPDVENAVPTPDGDVEFVPVEEVTSPPPSPAPSPPPAEKDGAQLCCWTSAVMVMIAGVLLLVALINCHSVDAGLCLRPCFHSVRGLVLWAKFGSRLTAEFLQKLGHVAEETNCDLADGRCSLGDKFVMRLAHLLE